MVIISNSLEKAIELMLLFTPERSVLSLAEVARLSGMPKPTVYRLLSTLETSGFISRTIDRRYKLGLKLLELGNLVAEQLELRSIALPHMQRLRDILQMTVQLLVRDGIEAVYIEKVETTHPVRLYTRMGRRALLHAGACPRALLAFLPDKERESLIVKIPLKSYTQITISSPDELRLRISREISQGYTVSLGELVEGTAAVGMPIRNFTGQVVASLSVAGSLVQFPAERIPAIATEVKRTVDAISQELGYRNNFSGGEQGK
ncbi:MAG: IclR family transcriptional regulator [Bacillota bacterium]